MIWGIYIGLSFANLGDSVDTCPLKLIIFIFMQFSGKFYQIIGLHPRLENPRPTTAYDYLVVCCVIVYLNSIYCPQQCSPGIHVGIQKLTKMTTKVWDMNTITEWDALQHDTRCCKHSCLFFLSFWW